MAAQTMSDARGDEDLVYLVAGLYEDHYTSIFAYLYHLVGDAAAAHDLAQETFLRLYREREKLTNVQNRRAWIYRIASHVAVDALRQRRRQRWLPWEQISEQEPDVGKAIDEGSEQQVAMEKALAALPALRLSDLNRFPRPHSASFQQLLEKETGLRARARRWLFPLANVPSLASSVAGVLVIALALVLLASWISSFSTEIAEPVSPTRSVNGVGEAPPTDEVTTIRSEAVVVQSTPTEERPEPSQTPVATPDLPAIIVAGGGQEILGSFPSPDDRWRAEVVVYPCRLLTGTADEVAYEQLRLVDTTGSNAIVADEQLRYCGGLGAFGLQGLFWSANSRFFYYTNAREGVPDGCGFWQPPFLRLDAATGETEQLGPGERSPDGGQIAAFPDRQRFAVWEVGGSELASAEVAIPEAEIGPIAWSPAGDALVYLQASSFCPSGSSYLVHLNLSEFEPAVLLETETPGFVDLAWEEQDHISLFDAEGGEWRFDLSSGELRSATEE